MDFSVKEKPRDKRGSDKNVLVSMEIKFPTTILKLLFTITKLFRIFFMHTEDEYCELLQQIILKSVIIMTKY